MELTIYTETVIDSSYYLRNYEGKCTILHEHSWKICIWIRGNFDDLNNDGLLFDFTNIKELKGILDHTLLNNLSEFYEKTLL